MLSDEDHVGEESMKVNSSIDFDRYELESSGRPVSYSITRSTLTSVSTSAVELDDEDSGICIEEVGKLIPENVLKTFQPDDAIVYKKGGETETSIAKTLYAGLSHALNGNSVVTAPVLYKGFEWLGSITVKPGELKGNSVIRYRTYSVQAEILAGGHVLPWKIGREWRYSELRKLLVDELSNIVRKNELDSYFNGLQDKFPPKNWQTRNSDETAEARGLGIQVYISNVFQITNKILEEKDNERKSKRNKRKSKVVSSSTETSSIQTMVDAYLGGSTASTRRPSMDILVNEGIREIIDLIVSKILNIDRRLRHDIAKLSTDLGVLITAAPTEHSQVTKEFKLTPQQAL